MEAKELPRRLNNINLSVDWGSCHTEYLRPFTEIRFCYVEILDDPRVKSDRWFL